MVGAPDRAGFAARGEAGAMPPARISSMSYRGRLWTQVALAFGAGVASFALAAVLSAAARGHVPVLLVGGLLLLVVLAVARFAGILFALPVGVVIILAYDWFILPPLRDLDGATVFLLGLFLSMSVIVGAVTSEATRRAVASERARAVLAEEQAGLRRVATLVAKGATSEEVFTAVTSEVGRLLEADVVVMDRYDADGTEVVLSVWSDAAVAGPVPVGTREPLGGRNVSTIVFETGRPARLDGYGEATGELGEI